MIKKNIWTATKITIKKVHQNIKIKHLNFADFINQNPQNS